MGLGAIGGAGCGDFGNLGVVVAEGGDGQAIRDLVAVFVKDLTRAAGLGAGLIGLFTRSDAGGGELRIES